MWENIAGRKDTLAPVVSTLRGRAPPSPRRSDAFGLHLRRLHSQLPTCSPLRIDDYTVTRACPMTRFVEPEVARYYVTPPTSGVAHRSVERQLRTLLTPTRVAALNARQDSATVKPRSHRTN